MNVLVVDDVEINWKFLRVTFEAADHVEALQILARETANAIISGILMSNMDGFRLCHTLRKSERLHRRSIQHLHQYGHWAQRHEAGADHRRGQMSR